MNVIVRSFVQFGYLTKLASKKVNTQSCHKRHQVCAKR